MRMKPERLCVDGSTNRVEAIQNFVRMLVEPQDDQLRVAIQDYKWFLYQEALPQPGMVT